VEIVKAEARKTISVLHRDAINARIPEQGQQLRTASVRTRGDLFDSLSLCPSVPLSLCPSDPLRHVLAMRSALRRKTCGLPLQALFLLGTRDASREMATFSERIADCVLPAVTMLVPVGACYPVIAPARHQRSAVR